MYKFNFFVSSKAIFCRNVYLKICPLKSPHADPTRLSNKWRIAVSKSISPTAKEAQSNFFPRPLHAQSAECHYCFRAVCMSRWQKAFVLRQPGQMKVEKETTCQNCVRWMEKETWSRSRIARARAARVMPGAATAAVPPDLYHIKLWLSFAGTVLLRTLSHFGNELPRC